MSIEPFFPGEFSVSHEAKLPTKLLDFIKEGKEFLIAGHEDPDGDCVGSQLALTSAIKRLGKEAIPCTGEPFKRTELKSLEHFFLIIPSDNKDPADVPFNKDPASNQNPSVILLDCSDLKRCGKFSEQLKNFPIAVIDHHKTADCSSLPAETPCYIDKSAPSTTVLIMKLILALGLEINREEAEYLFFGLCTDTGFFRHLDGDGAEAFEIAAYLIRCGANPKIAYSNIYGGKSLDSRRLIGNLLIRAESHYKGKLIVSTQKYEETNSINHEGRDSDSLYQLLQSVENVEAIVIIHQITPETCAVGLRSYSWVDVGSIARTFGGGGHKNASGFTMAGNIEELREKIIEAFKNVLTMVQT